MSAAYEGLKLTTETSPGRAGRREWLGLAVLMLPTLLIAMDLTVLHLAIPSIARDLKPTSSELLWIIDIYGFLIAGSLITLGTLGDRVGRRKLLLFGAGAFGAASVLAALSTTPTMLIATRALLGIAGATLMPSTMSLLRNMFVDPRQRTVAIGIWVSGFSAGSAIGPLLGGLLLEYFWWGSVFLLGVPVMALLLLIGPKLLPEYRDPNPGKFDLVSAAMSLAGVLSVIYGVKSVVEHGVVLSAILPIAAGLAIGALFVVRQLRLKTPFIDLKLFRVPAFSASLMVNTIGIFALFGVFVFVAQYMQLVAGLSPLEAGLWTLPGAVAFVISSNLAPKVVRRFRAAYVVSAGLWLTVVGVALLVSAGTGSLAIVVASWVVMSIGMGPTFTLTSDLILGSAPPERAGAAAAVSETSFELGGALGIAVIGSIGTAIYRARLERAMPDDVPPEAAAAAIDTLGGALVAAAELPAETATALVQVARGSFVDGLQLTAAISTILLAGAAVVAAIALRKIGRWGERTGHGAPRQAAPVQTPVAGPTTAGD